MNCATCLIDAVEAETPIKDVPDAVTQISGTLLCAICAYGVSATPGAMQRDMALRSRVFIAKNKNSKRPGPPNRGRRV